jgi:hypothetical protein
MSYFFYIKLLKNNPSTKMNPLSLLTLQNRIYDPKIVDQAQDLFERISKAILKDQNYILYDDYIYPTNRLILQNKGYFIHQNKIVWNDFSE